MTIPGIGPFVAILLTLEIGDIARFPSAKHLASYTDLTPRVRASADRIRTGHIGKEGNRLVRWALVLAATQGLPSTGASSKLVPNAAGAQGQTCRSRSPRAPAGRNCLSGLEDGDGLLVARASEYRVGVRSYPNMVFGPLY